MLAFYGHSADLQLDPRISRSYSGPGQKRSRPDTDTNCVNVRPNSRRSDTANIDWRSSDCMAGRYDTCGDPAHNLLNHSGLQ